MSEKKTVRDFKKKYQLSEINSRSLQNVLEKQGYAVIKYNGITDSDDVRTLIEVLNLQDQILHSKCFTFQNSKYRLVFVHEDLNEEELTIAFAHEEGHIWKKHLSHNSVFGEDVVQEHEANEFAHYLISKRKLEIWNKLPQYGKWLFFVVCIIILFFAVLALAHSNGSREKECLGEFYLTSTGRKYHEKDCIFIKNKTNIRKMTQEEFDSGMYNPCKICLPNR